ncbi:hypothetical protein HGA88_07000 [Candidatus Roizmanbacteria bacterium]|nr:hypothetical protein [Candidatus Roizmanbacteria bacterium]
MKKIVVLNGIHGSGKSTLGKRVTEKDSRFKYFGEIGEQVYTEVHYKNLRSYEAYDSEIFRREIARDAKLLETPEIPVVETWHIENLAYASVRSPQLRDYFKQMFERQLHFFDPVVVFISIDWDTFRERSKKGNNNHQMDTLVAFTERVQSQLLEIYDEYGIRPLQVRNEGRVEDTVTELYEGLVMRGLTEDKVSGKEQL